MKTIIVAAILVLGLALHGRGQTVIDTWSADGGAWTASNQPDFTAATGGGGTLYTDEAIVGGTNHSVGNTGAVWTSAVTSGSGIYGDYYYTLFSTPAITVSTVNVLSGVEAISFSLEMSGTMASTSVGLDFGGVLAADGFESEFLGTDPGFGANIYRYTWMWDVNGLTASSSFSLGWTTPGNHTAYFTVELTQQAIPEPSTCALVFVGGVALLLLRRRRNKAWA
jgi:hypothetical protein